MNEDKRESVFLDFGRIEFSRHPETGALRIRDWGTPDMVWQFVEQPEVMALYEAFREHDEALGFAEGRIAGLEEELAEAQRDAARLREALKAVVAFWDSITIENCVNDIHVKARAALAQEEK